MVTPKTVRAVRNAIANLDDDLEFAFWHIDELVEHLGHLPDITLAYCFTQIEYGHRRMLYAGLVRRYRLNPELCWEAVLGHDIKRKDFPTLFASVFEHDFPVSIHADLKSAERVRDRLIHGKEPAAKEMWGAVCALLNYATEMNTHLRSREGIPAFGKLGGVLSKKGSPTLPRNVSALALKGLGMF